MQADDLAGRGETLPDGRYRAVVTFIGVTLLYVVGQALSRLAGEPFSLVDVVVLAFFAFPVVGVLVAYRRPGNQIAWLCLVIGLSWGVEQLFWGIALYGMAYPQSVSRPELWAAIGNPFWVPGIFIVPTFILQLFPEGALPSPRWRGLSWFSGLTLTVVFVLTLFQPTTSGYGRPDVAIPFHPAGALGDGISALLSNGTLFAVLLSCVAASVVAVVVRYRGRRASSENSSNGWPPPERWPPAPSCPACCSRRPMARACPWWPG